MSNILNKKRFVVISAEWCGPCRLLKSMLPEIEKAIGNKDIEFKVLDCEKDEEGVKLAHLHNITGIPRVLFFEGDNLVGDSRGLLSVEKYVELATELFDLK